MNPDDACEHCGQPTCYSLTVCKICGGTYPSCLSKCNSWVHNFDAEVREAIKNGYWKPDLRGNLKWFKPRNKAAHRVYSDLLNGQAFFSEEHHADHKAKLAMAEREELARLLSAEVLGIEYDTLYQDKRDWIHDLGRRHDCNTSYKWELLNAADSILKRYEKRKDV